MNISGNELIIHWKIKHWKIFEKNIPRMTLNILYIKKRNMSGLYFKY